MAKKSCEERWREYYAERARRWRGEPWALLGTLEAIMGFQELTAGQRLQRMQWAIEAYNNAVEEAGGRHRTSCTEHTED